MSFISRRQLRVVLTATVAAAFLVVGVSSANAAVSLKWNITNATYASGCTGNATCSWLSYLLRPGPAGPAGIAEPIAPATGPSLTSSDPKGPNEVRTWVFPSTAGSINTRTFNGEFSFDGGLTLNGPGHGITQSIEQPRFVFNGDGTGQVFAHGERAENTGPAQFDDTSPIFTIDYSNAVCTLNWDGTETFGPIQPSIATSAGYAYPALFPVGTGPGNVNVIGEFDLTGVVCSGRNGADGATGATGADGAKGDTGAQGPVGPAGKDATVKTIKLKKAIFGSKRVVAKITKKGKTVGYAEVKGKKAKLTYVGKLKGTYTLKTVTGKSRKATIKIG